MAQELLVAGGGIAGLAAAVAARSAGWEARVFEQAAAFAEVGAGLQLGPNATRLLARWPTLSLDDLRAFRPDALRVRDAFDGRELGRLRLGAQAEARYGAPYFTAHRADLHAALLRAAESCGVRLHAGKRIDEARVDGACVQATLDSGKVVEAEALAVADGVWSGLRSRLLGDGAAPPTGHVAYRALLPMASLPASLRTQDVEAWLGPSMHLVRYPVRGGELVNIAGFVEGSAAPGWDHEAAADGLRRQAARSCAALQALVDAVPTWRLWPVHDRPPVTGAHEMAFGRAAFLGDAAHPMRPYLAQGAGMAIEDAAALQRALAACDGRVLDVPTILQRFALDRWQRCARVQQRSRRNGRVFHADGALRIARNLALRTLGERLLDQPWLYRGG